MKHYATFILICIVTVLSGFAQTDGWSTDAERLRAQVRQSYVDEKADASAARKYLSQQKADGTWADIDYANKSKSSWLTIEHLKRAHEMALDYETSGRSNKKMLNGAIKAIRYWTDNQLQSDNWWYNTIDVPSRMLKLAYILDSDLPADMVAKITPYLDIIDVSSQTVNGGDRIQAISDHTAAALWARDYPEVKRSLDLLQNEARECAPQQRGIQPDLSMHHRPDGVDCTLTYGQNLPYYFSFWATRTAGTPLAFDPERVHFVIDYFIDGISRHTVNYLYREPGSWNRELVRRGGYGVNRQLTDDMIAMCGGYRLPELANIKAIQSGKKKYDERHAKFFWDSEYFIIQSPLYTSSVRMHSARTHNVEYPYNGEGLRNHYRSDGACHLSVTGKEYQSIVPVADYRMISGTTSLLLEKFLPESECQKQGLSPFVGGVTDGIVGAAAFDFKSPHSSLKARKGWFFFPDGYVCLGCGIRATEPEQVVTTIEQCEGGDFSQAPDGSWATNNGVKYQVLDGKKAIVSCKPQTAPWSNIVRDVKYSAEKATAKVFSMYISHGKRPSNSSYAYAVIPDGIGKDATTLWHVISNTSSLQAVESTGQGICEAIFYKSGKLKFFGKKSTLSVNKPCMALYADGHLYISDPSRTLTSLIVKFNGHKYTVALPQGRLAGSTVQAF